VLFRPFAKMVRAIPVPILPYLTAVTGINSFVEPNFLVYEVHYPPIDRALANFCAKLPFGTEKDLLVQQCRERRISRIQLCDEQVREAVRVHTSLGRLALIKFADFTNSRNCPGKVHPLALCHLCRSLFADFSQERCAYFCTSYEIFPGEVLR
jgi:hypothetical protein